MNLENLIFQASQTPAAGKNLKPYQGLKLSVLGASAIPTIAGKNLKPYQGLKRSSTANNFVKSSIAGKNLKPYQGLKRQGALVKIGDGTDWPEKT